MIINLTNWLTGLINLFTLNFGGSAPPSAPVSSYPPYNGVNVNMTGPTNPPSTQPYQANYSGISGIIQNLVNSGAFQNYQTNPYAPQGSNNPVNVPYGLQQQSMFGMNNVNPYGGSYSQWSPYGNTYGGFNQYGNGFGGWNPNNTTAGQTSNVAPPPNTTGPTALAQLNNMFGQTPPPNA